MPAVEALGDALRTLAAQPLRSLLTLFGVGWGTGSIVFLMSWGLGVVDMVERGMTRVGKNAVFVFAGNIGEDFTPASDRRHLWFTLDDVEAVRRRARLAQSVTPQTQRFVAVSYRETILSIELYGVEPEILDVRGVQLAAGRNFRRDDLAHRRRVALLGYKARRKLLGTRGGVGSRIRIDGRSFEVIGILAPVGTQLMRMGPQEIDDQVWIPITSLFAFGPRYGSEADVVDTILFRVDERSVYPAAAREVRAILADRLRISTTDEEAIEIMSPIDFLQRIPSDAGGGVVFWIAFGTLAIGGIGLLNMMLDSVQERRSEIGVRQAIGARRRDILLQFFTETFLLTALGGAVGLGIGTGAVWGLSRLHAPDLIPLPVMDASIVGLALLAMIAVGVASAVLPAWRASRVDPAEILRVE